MVFNAITYGTLPITSEELLTIRVSCSLKINEVDTFNAYTITSPGNISPIRWTISAKIRKDATTKFNNWLNEVQTRPLKTLNIFKLNYPEVYLTNVDVTATEINLDGDVLWFDMQLQFTQNINFAP